MKTILLLFFPLVVFSQKKERLPNPINTSKSIEYAPSVTADGQTLIYQSDQFGVFINAGKKVPDINAEGKTNVILEEYETKFFGVYETLLQKDGTWKKPEHIAPINDYANENLTPVMGGPSVSYDGNELYFFANFGKNGYGREDIFYSERTKNGWSKPKNVGSNINSDAYEGFPSISPDGKKLYFTREILGKKVDGKQCYRIMVSEKNRLGDWRKPYELPPPVNMDCEKAPRILADGKTLVFSSIKKGGMGDFDLYKTVQQADGKWSEPINLEFVNTRKSDQFVSVSPCGDLMYFVSDGDIFTTTIPESLRPVRSATIQGFVKDSSSGAAIKAKIVVKNKSSQETIAVLDNNPSDGRFTAIVPFGMSYELSVNLPDYFTKTILIEDADMIDCQPIPKDFELKKIPTNAKEIVALAQKKAPVNQAPVNPSIANQTTKPVSDNNSFAQKADGDVTTNKQSTTSKPIEELELIADSPETSKESLSAQGEKPQASQTILKYALILRIVDKETGAFISNPRFRLTKNNADFALSPETNGNDYIFKVNQGDAFKIAISADNYLDFEANIPAMDTDRRVTVKLAAKLKSSLQISMLDADNNEKLSGEILIKSSLSPDTLRYKINNGDLSIPLLTNDELTVVGRSPKHFDLLKKVIVEIPKDGNKIIDLELKLALDEYTLELLATDLETGNPIPNAVFYVFDDSGQRVLELLADREGKATGKLQKNGRYRVQLLADGFKTAEQTLDNLLQNTKVIFKPVPDKVKTHELKVLVFDRFTEEELYPVSLVNNEQKGKAPFFISGPAEAKFDIQLGDELIKEEKYVITFDEQLMSRVSTELKAQKNYYPFYFRVFDQDTKKMIPRAALKVIDQNNRKEIQELDGAGFVANINPDNNYAITLEIPGYEATSQRFTGLDWIKERNFEKDLFVKPELSKPATVNTEVEEVIQTKTFGEISKGKKITLENIYFDQSSPVLRKESFEQLDELVKILKENPKLKIEIRGHTDNVGDFYLNVKLSKDRSQAVVNYLTDKGIAKNRLDAVGKGPVEPVAPNNNEENKKKNRRVEFIVL